MLINVLLGIGSILCLAIVVIVVLVARQPAAFSIARSTTISAPASAIFPHVNNLHAWEAWSPFEKLDPGRSKRSPYEGPKTGVGASYAWSGNSKAGEGKSTITESHPNDLVRLRLEFTRPFTATNVVDFTASSKKATTPS